MSLIDAMRISASGLTAQRTRVNLAASNLANAETTKGPDGEVYKRMDPVFESIVLDEDGDTEGVRGVKVSEIEKDESGGKEVFMPHHPDADARGFVTLPDVDPIHEVVNLMSAQRGYDANATALETSKSLARRALDIMR